MLTRTTMNIAIVEREYLVALDLQRVIEENFNCNVHIIAPENAVEQLSLLAGDVLLLDCEIDPPLLDQIMAAPVAKPSTSVSLTFGDKECNNPPYVAQVTKPFTDQQVINALLKAFQ